MSARIPCWNASARKESMTQALECARPGSMIGYVGVPHGVEFDGQQLFFSQKGLMGGPAPVRRFLPHLMDLVLDRKINPGKVFDLELPLVGRRRGLPGDGRAPRHQGSAARLIQQTKEENNAKTHTRQKRTGSFGHRPRLHGPELRLWPGRPRSRQASR